MHVHAFVTENEWEGKEDRDRNMVGGIGRRNKRRRQKDDRRGMSDGDNEWEMQTVTRLSRSIVHEHPPAEMTGVRTCE